MADPRDLRYEYLPFFEAYFSNFIEGTEFELDEAVAIVYDGKQVPGRADDTHDLVGTYMVVADLAEMTTLAAAPQEFLDLLRSRHATIMGGRPDKRPGVFKEAVNRAGDSLFVLPGLVAGTLRAGSWLCDLSRCPRRGVSHFLSAPIADGVSRPCVASRAGVRARFSGVMLSPACWSRAVSCLLSSSRWLIRRVRIWIWFA